MDTNIETIIVEVNGAFIASLDAFSLARLIVTLDPFQTRGN